MPASPATDRLLQQVREQERQRIAALLHDEVGGQLLGLKLALERLCRQLDNTSPPDQDWLREQLQMLQAQTATCLDASTRITGTLALPQLQAGLPAALHSLCRTFAWQTGIACDFNSALAQDWLNAEQSRALYLICREALNNVGKHAQASHASIQLVVDESGAILKISDNGSGIAQANPEPMTTGHGLANMASHAREIGARLQQTAAPGQSGCCWEVHLSTSTN